MKLCLRSVCLSLMVGWLGLGVAGADPATHRLPDQTRQRQVWAGDMLQPYMVSGCLSTVPVTSLTLPTFACEAYVRDTTTNELVYVGQSTTPVGPLNAGNGNYWIAVHRDVSTAVASWTRQTGTSYLWQLSSGQPTIPTGAALLMQVAVASGAITNVIDFRIPRSFALAGVYSITDPLYGATGDGTTDDSPAIRAAERALTQWTLTAVTGVGGSETMGGATLYFPATTRSYRMASTVTLTASSLSMRGAPAKITLDAGVTAFSMSGSPDQNPLTVEELHFSGGFIAIDTGTNAVNRPLLVQNCKFVNQTEASIRLGVSLIAPTIRDSTFTGNHYGIWLNGSSTDVVSIERNIFIYNTTNDIYVGGSSAPNVLRIINNDFVGITHANPTLNTNVFLDLGTAQASGYSVIAYNKFGAESRTAGYPIRIDGTQPLLGLKIVHNLIGFDSTAVGQFGIYVGAPVEGLIVEDNDFVFCTPIDTGSQVTTQGVGQNRVKNNTLSPFRLAQDEQWRVNWRYVDDPEPTRQKTNLVTRSRSDAVQWPTVSNITFTSLTTTNERGEAAQASTFLATAAGNLIRSASLTLEQAKPYTLSLWLRQDVEALVELRVIRGGTYVLLRSIFVPTSYKRFTFEVRQNFEVNPFVIEMVLANGRTLTIGSTTVVEGRDVGDLEKYASGERIVRPHFYATAVPGAGTGFYGPAGSIIWNTSGTVGQPIGWIITVAGDPPTVVAMPNF